MKYVRRATKNTPEIIIDLTGGSIELRGRSSPENSLMIYAPLLKVLRSNRMNMADIKIDVRLEYFNTSSSKCIYDIFRQLKRMEGCGTNVTINWYYDPVDEDMLESGQDYYDILGMNFRFLELAETSDFI